MFENLRNSKNVSSEAVGDSRFLRNVFKYQTHDVISQNTAILTTEVRLEVYDVNLA